MIDFQNGSVMKLMPVANDSYNRTISPLLIPGERVVAAYRTMRDGVVFTDKRIISLNYQGVTGKKVDCTSLPYKKIQTYSIETAGVIDLDGELCLWFSSLGMVRFEFCGSKALPEICRIISSHVL